MTYETKTLLKAVAFLVGLAAALICAGLLATSCDGSQFPVRVVSSGYPHCPPSLSMRTEPGDCCTFRLAVGMHNLTAEFAPFRALDRSDFSPSVGATGSGEVMESAKETIHPCSDTCRTPSAGQFISRGIGRDSRDVAHVGCESVAKNRTPLDILSGIVDRAVKSQDCGPIVQGMEIRKGRTPQMGLFPTMPETFNP